MTPEILQNLSLAQLLEIKPEAVTDEAAKLVLRDRLLIAWQDSKAALEVAKENEMKLRVAAVATMHDSSKSGTTENVELGNGYKAKMKVPVNYGFIKDGDKIDKKRIEAALTKIEKAGPAGVLIADRLIKWKPELSLTEYKQLPDNFKKIIDDVIVTNDGTPTLEIVPPKA